MTYPELPELPDRITMFAEGSDAEAVQAYALAHGKAVQEWAAKVCDVRDAPMGVEQTFSPADCAQAIREGKP